MDTGFNYYHGADPGEYDLVVSNSEGGLDRLRELGARRAEAVFWGADPDFFFAAAGREGDGRLLLRLRRQVPPRVDEGARRRAVARAAGRRFRSRRPRLPGRRGLGAGRRRRPVQRVLAGDLRRARQPQHHAPLARNRPRLVDLPAVRARLGRGGDRLQPARGDRALVRAREGAPARRPTPTRPSPPTASCSTTRQHGGRARAARPASASSTSTPTSTAPGSCSTCSGVATAGRRMKKIAIVPALNEEESIAVVIDEIRAFDGSFAIVVVDDGSVDRTAQVAAARGAHVLRLPFNLGIGGAVQTGFRFALRERLRARGARRRRRPARPGRAAEDPRARARRRGGHRRRLALRRRGQLPVVAVAPRRASACSRGSSRGSSASE